jgi:hypothetical protein
MWLLGSGKKNRDSTQSKAMKQASDDDLFDLGMGCQSNEDQIQCKKRSPRPCEALPQSSNIFPRLTESHVARLFLPERREACMEYQVLSKRAVNCPIVRLALPLREQQVSGVF